MALIALGAASSSHAATPPGGVVPCPSFRPTSPLVTVAYPTATQIPMIVTQMQVVFDTCRVALVLSGGTPTETADVTMNRMHSIALEAHYLQFCPTPKPTDDTGQANQEFTDTHEWGCGPYPAGSTSGGTPTPPPPSGNACTNVTDARPTATPTAKAPPHDGDQKNLRTTHPPVGKLQVIYDLCVAAYDLYNANTLTGTPNVLASPTVDAGGVTWEQRFAHLSTEVYLWLTCGDGLVGYPPQTNDPDFAAKRNYGCGPYGQTPTAAPSGRTTKP